MDWWIVYLLMGLFVGFFAGMLGIGGGTLLVAIMVFLFQAQEFPSERIVHLALGTALTSIVFTSLSSVRAHHGHGAVRWDIVRRATPGLLVGTISGTFVAQWLSSRYLAIFFVAFLYYSSVHILLGAKPKPSRQLPGPAGMWIGSGLVGLISSLVGAGGGIIAIPLLTMCNVPMRLAVGTSAALGLPVSVAGSIGYIAHGLGQSNLPPLSFGYVYVPALVGIVIGTFVTVPLGAKVAHSMPVPRLQRIFAVFLFLLASRMLWTLFHMR